MQPTVLFIGPQGHDEFAAALSSLRRQASVTVQPTVLAALRILAETEYHPATIVLGQSRRGEYSPGELNQLQQAVPLAKTIGLLGSWCEGETRSGRPAEGWSRVYWHQFEARVSIELFAGAGGGKSLGKPSDWYYPKTATETERALVRSNRPLPSGSGMVAINTLKRVDYDALADACKTAGYRTLWCQDAEASEIEKVHSVLWDRWGLQGADLIELTSWREKWQELPLVATIGFPRKQDYRLVAEGAVEAIVGKPFLLGELLYALEAVINGQADVKEAA